MLGMNTKSRLVELSLDDLEAVNGGMRWEDFPPSNNVEDRRPQSQGGPVPDADWQAEQDGYNNSCWWGADGTQYSGDPGGGDPTPMPDWGGEW